MEGLFIILPELLLTTDVVKSNSATVSSTFSRRFRRVAVGLAASLALGALSAHADFATNRHE